MTRSVAPTELIDQLARATLVHVDARVLAFHLLGDPRITRQTDEILRAIREGLIHTQTSTVTLYQILTEVYRQGEKELARQVARTLQVHPGLAIVSVSPEIAIQAAEVRAQLGGRPERAIQIATALVAGAEIYLTTGSGIRRIAGMTVLNAEDYADGTAVETMAGTE